MNNADQFTNNGMLSSRAVSIPFNDSILISGFVREATVGEFISVSELLVDFLELDGEGEGGNKAMFDAFRDIAKEAPKLAATVSSLCQLTLKSRGRENTQIHFLDLPVELAAAVLGELKEVNSSFLSQLLTQAKTQEAMVATDSTENTST